MRQSLVPVLLLATVAFSSSNVLPMLTIKQLNTEPLDLGSQQNDNIFSNSYHPRNILNDIIYTISIATSRNDRQPHTQYEIDNSRLEDNTNILNKHDNYNGEGFRKEQWHNYPRQLDRLHKYLYEHHNTDKRNPDPDDPNTIDDYNEEPSPIITDNDIKINEIPQKKNDDTHDDYKAIIATNPFLIFKIRLACLGSELRNTDLNKASDLSSELEYNPDGKEEKMIDNIINPDVSITKVKREEINDRAKTEDLENSMTKRRAVKKRIFSLWSRLQSFNHKGHELQHRRHLHAFYGLPDGDGGSGVLTAETRATFLRPPGSPLRWG